jgi:hypothetical protein
MAVSLEHSANHQMDQDTLYAWRLPLGSENPKLVTLLPDSSEHELALGPLPLP